MLHNAGDKVVWKMPGRDGVLGEVTADVEDGASHAQFRADGTVPVAAVPLSQIERPIRIEVKVTENKVEVRFAPTDSPSVAAWDNLFPGSVHTPTGWTQRDLQRLGDGFHFVEKRTPKE